MKDGEAISDDIIPNCSGYSSPMLEISSFSSEHEGCYKCIVRNEDNTLESSDAHLKGNSSTDVDKINRSQRQASHTVRGTVVCNLIYLYVT